MCESLAEVTKTTVLLQIFCRNANVHSDLIALKCKECVAYTIRFVSFFLLLLIRRLLLRQMYRAHQSVQINAIMVHVIHAIARRYARASVHTNKHTIKRINSHCQIHTCSCGLAELKWLYFYLAPFIHERERESQTVRCRHHHRRRLRLIRSFFLIFFCSIFLPPLLLYKFFF